MDLYDFCSEEYKKELEPARKVKEEMKDKEILAKGEGSSKVEEVPQSSEASSSVVKKSLTGKVKTGPSLDGVLGCFDLMGVITHKGRSSNSGHYVSWVKQEDNQWVEFDDEELILRKQDEIMQLSGHC